MMSGNYDYPPASSRRPSRNSNDRPQSSVLRLQHLRNLVNSERNRTSAYNTTRALETLNQEIEEHHFDRARNRTNFEQARAAVDRQIQQLQSEISNPAERSSIWLDQIRSARSPSTLGVPELMDGQRSGGRSSRRRAFRSVERRDGRPRDAAEFTSLLDDAVSRSQSPSLTPQSSRDGRGRLKRRKLDSDDNREGLRGFNYGQFGQVVPGALKMEIASCDGGTYDPDGDSSFPGNVLRNDQSVYCTKADRCNLVLRHRGEAPFCLKKIVIKAPRTGFDAPIQEGMIFVSMTSDELLARTAQYHIQYSSARRRRRNRQSGMQPSQEYLNAFRSPLQSLERTVLIGPDSSAPDFDLSRSGSDPQTEFRVTTEYDESEDKSFVEPEDDDVTPSIAERRLQRDDSMERDLRRLQPDSLERNLAFSTTEESESDDDDHTFTRGHEFHRRHERELHRRVGSLRRQFSAEERELQRRRQAPSFIDPIPPPPAPSGDTHRSSSSSTEVLKPHARFFIEREKSMVSIKFDPPPSGRFILIKLWSPRSDGNIDIQSIIAHGFAGPRFFPAGSFR